jgi:mono/diheme cytochrome c family protein
MAEENQTPTRPSAWQNFWTQILPAEVQLILATVFTLGIIIAVAWVGINEPARMQEFTASYDARSIENGAVIFDSTCSGCHGPQGQGIQGVGPALNTPELFNGERLAEMGWSGSLEDFVELTVAAGRPSVTDWPAAMPTWSQEYGGPLRPDEVKDVTNYVLNWEETALAGEVLEAAEAPPPDEEPEDRFCGFDIDMELPEGDVERGRALYEGELGCAGCHVAGANVVAPPLEGMGARAGERVPGLSAEKYVHESIVKAEAFVVEGYEPIMGTLDFGDKLTCQEIADLVAFNLSQ